MPTKTRSGKREEILRDILVTAIESGSYGSWMDVRAYVWDCEAAHAFAVIVDTHEGDGREHRITLDMIAKGLRIIRESKPGARCQHCRNGILSAFDVWTSKEHGDECPDSDGPHVPRDDSHGTLITAAGKILYYGGDSRKALVEFDRTNGDEGDMDVIGALAAVECAIYGQAVYG